MNYLHKTKLKSDRQFLDESRITSRYDRTKKLPLMEVEGGLSYIDRCKRNVDLPLYLTGILSTGDQPNRNRRVYPFDYLKREFIRYTDECIKTGLSYGSLNHPKSDEDSTVVCLLNASHTIDDVWFKGKEVWGRIKILNAFMPQDAPGLKVRGYILNGKSVGMSTRMLGSVWEDKKNDLDIVEDDMELITVDIVSSASSFGSEIFQLTESKNSRLLIPKERKVITESQCFGGLCGLSKPTINELRMLGLNEPEKTYLNILGVEKFLQIKRSLV